MLVIDRKNFLSKSHLLCEEDKFSWTSEVNENTLPIEKMPEIAKILGFHLDPLIPDTYKASADILNISNPPWCFYIGKNKYLSLVKVHVQQSFDILKSVNKEHLDIHVAISKFLDILQPCKYDLKLVDNGLDKHFEKSIKHHLKNDTIQPPQYLRTKTKTGRLSVNAGPNVLNMHAGLRKGVISGYSIDFVSMEPNLLLALQKRPTKTDLYESIRAEVFKDKISRTKVKIATMSALYGSDRSDKFAKKISEYFQLEDQVATLEKTIQNDTIKNHYSRLINLDGARGRHLLALWLQSSAADAALYGFYNFYKESDIIPHWIIHDGLIFIYKGEKKQTKYLDVGLNIKLPVKVEKL